MTFSIFTGPMIAAAIGGLLSVLALDLMRGKPGRKQDGGTILEYGAAPRFFALAGLCLPLLGIFAAWHSQNGLLTAALCLFALISAYFTIMAVYLSFFVSMAFDEAGVYYHSPLRGGRLVLWSAIERIGYSDAVQMHYLKAANGEMFWLSRCMNGFDELEARVGFFQNARTKSASLSEGR